MQTALYLWIACLSRTFVFGERFAERPIVLVLTLFTACFVLHLAGLMIALRCRSGRQLTVVLWGGAVIFRAAMLWSEPIQEIDIYRYVWDGAALANGVSPFRYSPREVIEADAASTLPDDLKRLVAVRCDSPALAQILHRIHYGELPTVYPPVSQAVFALGGLLSPPDATLEQRVVIFKSLIVAFDLATIGLLWRLLRLTGRHPGWIVAYAWCPLVIKEFANSGHLDSIAVCLSVAALVCLAQAMFADSRPRVTIPIVTAGVLLGLAIGAKLYPAVLLPLVTVFCFVRYSARVAAGCFLATAVTGGLALAPMLLTVPPERAELVAEPTPQTDAKSDAQPPPKRTGPLAGLTTFLSRWEMNDFFFMLIEENLRPTTKESQHPVVWSAIVPARWRSSLVTCLSRTLAIEPQSAPFLVTRAVTSLGFLVLALWLAREATRWPTADSLLEAAFLTLAWFWMLSPTQNPWYWTWALPLVPFARGRAWLAMSGLVMAYYLRFWLDYHFADIPVLGTRYRGTAFFDFVVTWVEYAPWLFVLAGMAAYRKNVAANVRIRGFARQ